MDFGATFRKMWIRNAYCPWENLGIDQAVPRKLKVEYAVVNIGCGRELLTTITGSRLMSETATSTLRGLSK